jgi:hypothetical protein
MSKQVEIKAWCDNHGEGEAVPATVERIVNIDPAGKVSKVLVDLCEPCDKEVTGFLAHIQEIGVRVPTSGRPKAPAAQAAATSSSTRVRRPSSEIKEDTPDLYRTCPVCQGKPSVTRSAMGQHLYQKHDARLSDWDWDYDPKTGEGTGQPTRKPLGART